MLLKLIEVHQALHSCTALLLGHIHGKPIFRSSHLQAFDIVLHLALIQLVDKVSLVRVLPFLLQRVEHHTTELLDVMLLPG